MDYSEDAKNFFFNEENKKKKKQIKKRFGGDFYKEDDKLPPEMESQFLDNIIKFEENWEKTEEIEIYEYLDKPKFEILKNIKKAELPLEVDKVLDIYNEKNINIDVIEKEDVSYEDFYTFLTEELPKHKFYPIPGMTTNYIYEEFHPSDKLDSKDAIEDILYGFLNNYEYKDLHIAKEKHYNIAGKKVTREKFIESMATLFEDVDELIVREEVIFNKIEITDKSKVEADLILRYKQKVTSKEIDKIFSFIFELIRSEYGGMDIIGYELLS